MRALIFDGTRPVLTSAHPVPTPAPGEAVVCTLLAGISRTDLAVCEGRLDFTGVLGHEFVGTVESVEGTDGAGLTGKRVVGAISVFCGRCDMCQAGLRQHCRERTMLGISGRDGCLAERFVIPAANLVPVPDSVDDDHAVFAEPLAAALQAVRQLTIEGKPYITVLGDGTLGLLMVQVMAKLNASVRLVGVTPAKLELCAKWGLKHRHVSDVGRRADQDIVVDCTGSPSGLDLAMALVRPRGTIVYKTLGADLAGGLSDGSPDGVAMDGVLDLSPIVLNEITLVGSHRGPVGEAIALLERHEIDVLSLISRRVSLDDGLAALAAQTQPETIKVLVRL